MTTAFELATALELDGDVFRGVMPDRWQQGKGAFGGVVIGALTRAIVRTETTSHRRLRSLSADLCAPLMPGPYEIHVATRRRGGSISFYEARLMQEGNLIAAASAALAEARSVPPVHMHPAPPVQPPWNDVPPFAVEPPFGPIFGSNYEYRPTGPLPFLGGASATAEGWIREAVPPAIVDEAILAGRLDSWWSTLYALSNAPRMVVTVGYTMQILVPPRELAPEEPLFYRARGEASADNFFVEMRELWSGDRVVALNQQTFAILS